MRGADVDAKPLTAPAVRRLNRAGTRMFTICLDPGHGGRQSGVVREGAVEAELTLDIAMRARKLLERKYHVVLTREDDSTIALSERVAIAARTRADVFVSIHVNSAVNPRAGGYEVFVKPNPNPENLALASAILVQFAKRWPDRRNRGLKESNLLVLRQARPACLVESFFLSNATERLLLKQPRVRARVAEAIAWGCGNFIATVLEPPEARGS